MRSTRPSAYAHVVDAGDGENPTTNPFGSRAIPTDCGSIRVRWCGPADPVESIVLLHGGPGVSERYRETVV